MLFQPTNSLLNPIMVRRMFLQNDYVEVLIFNKAIIQLPGINTTLILNRNSQIHSFDSQSIRKFLHRHKDPVHFSRRFEFYREGQDLHLLIDPESPSNLGMSEAKPEEFPSMDAVIMRKDKECWLLTVAVKRSGDAVVEARAVQSK